jgi:hypothetical protein
LHSGARNASTVWLANQDCEQQILGVDAPGMFSPSQDGAGMSFLGAPILAHEAASTLGTVGDLVLVDPSQLVVFVTSQAFIPSVHVRFLNDEMCYRFAVRVNAQPLWNTPLTPLFGSSTQSMAVTLETRS